jgi:hypothetical protein
MLRLLFLFTPIILSAQISSSFEPKKIIIQDNVERYLFDYTQTDKLGFNKMHAPVNWTEPIIEASFEIRGIVLSGTLGLEFKEGIELIDMDRGFKIPKGKRVRIFNGGNTELILIEILQPAYDLKRVKQFNSFD